MTLARARRLEQLAALAQAGAAQPDIAGRRSARTRRIPVGARRCSSGSIPTTGVIIVASRRSIRR